MVEMNFEQALKRLVTENPDCNFSELRHALNQQVDYELQRNVGRVAQARAVAESYRLMTNWLTNGDEFDVLLTWSSIAKFISGRLPACAWCVCIAKQRAVNKTWRERDEAAIAEMKANA